MPDEMDVVGSLKKISRELYALENMNIERHQLFGQINGAAFLINWIADGLDRELELAQQRADAAFQLQVELMTCNEIGHEARKELGP